MVMILPVNQSTLDLPLQDYPTANRSAILELPLQDFDPTANQSEKSAARIYARFIHPCSEFRGFCSEIGAKGSLSLDCSRLGEDSG